MSIDVYTDGSCLKPSSTDKTTWKSGCGIYYVDDFEAGIPLGTHTNNYAELYAIQFALYMFINRDMKNKIVDNINIYSDSKYSIGVISGGNTVNKNIELVEKIKNMVEIIKNNDISIKLMYIKSHTNKKDIHSVGNNIVDTIAKYCANNQKKWFKRHV